MYYIHFILKDKKRKLQHVEATLSGNGERAGSFGRFPWPLPCSCKIIKNLFYFVPVTIVLY